MKKMILWALLAQLGFLHFAALGQSMTFTEVEAVGARPLTVAEARELVTGARVEFTLVTGSQRIWTNDPKGNFTVSRNTGLGNRRSGTGTWSINEDAAYCVSIDWGSMDLEDWCRRLYRVENRYYGFGLKAKPDTRSGVFRFSR